MYKFEEEKLIKEIQEKDPKRILLQLPEGLKKEGLRISNLIQNKCNTEVILSGEPMWGACDIAINEAKSLNCDLIILYGHAPFMEIDFPIIYLEARYEKDITNLTEQIYNEIKDLKSIALVTSVQHIHQIKKTKEFFEKKDINVKIPEAKGHALYDGQILGCEYTGLKTITKDVEAIIIIGNKFHALGAALVTNKPVFLLDPFNEKITDLTELKNKIIKQRAIVIDKAKQAKKLGIIIGLKPGQRHGSFDHIKEKIKQLDKEYVLISMQEINNEKLINLYDIDAFVELACPRIAIEDTKRFEKPILTAREFAVLCGDLTWEDLLEKGFL